MSRFLAAIYDASMAEVERAGLQAWRRTLLDGAVGRVLDVGAGTGANLPHYNAEVGEVVLLEPDPAMRGRLYNKVYKTPRAGRSPVEVSDGTLDHLPFPDASFDTVVSTLVLCSVDDPSVALAEIARVLRPGGQLLFIEHVAADASSARYRWQRRVEPLWKRLLGNCHLTRDTGAAIREAGFAVEQLERASMRKAVPLVRPTIRGVARKGA